MAEPATRIMITGAGGFVGRALLQRLAIDLPDATVLALANPEKLKGISATVHAIDVRGPKLMDVMESWRPHKIFHLAAKSSVAAAEIAKVEASDVSIRGAMNLAEGVRRFAPEAVVVFASSAEVYGRAFATGERLTEESAVSPANVYARAKLAAETILTDWSGDGATIRILRPLNHTGAGQDQRFVAPAFARQIAEIEAGVREPTVRVGNLDGARDFLDVQDVVDSYMAAADLERKPGALLLNVSSDLPRSLRSVLDDLLKLSGVEAAIAVDPARWRANDIATTLLSSDRLRELTGWRPKRSWSDTLSSLLEQSRRAVAEERRVGVATPHPDPGRGL